MPDLDARMRQTMDALHNKSGPVELGQAIALALEGILDTRRYLREVVDDTNRALARVKTAGEGGSAV